jgi:hypothetical protein
VIRGSHTVIRKPPRGKQNISLKTDHAISINLFIMRSLHEVHEMQVGCVKRMCVLSEQILLKFDTVALQHSLVSEFNFVSIRPIKSLSCASVTRNVSIF